jgi:hypothetical protein
VDRRYAQTRFYNGAPASDSPGERREALVRRYLGEARQRAHRGQSYGGSTGGNSSAGAVQGEVQRSRGDLVKDARKVFQEQGSGSLGARATLAAVRGFRPDPLAGARPGLDPPR